MDLFEKFIEENKNNIDEYEPDIGHFNRFEAKLRKQNAPHSLLNFKLWYIAASVIIIAGIAGLMYIKYQNTNVIADKQEKPVENNQLAFEKISPEYREVEIYLKSNVKKKLDEFNALGCDKQKIDYDLIMSEIQELDKTYNELRAELSVNTNDERIINAIIECYQNKINLLNKIINQVNKNC